MPPHRGPLPFYGLLFLAGHRFARHHYLWIAAGFLAVWGLELIYLGAMTGDPLYRFNISLHHDSSIDRTIDVAGNVIVHPAIDPLLVLLLNQEFMALFFLAGPLGAWLCFSRRVDPRLRHFAGILALFGLVWTLCVGAAQTLLPLNPRYFMISCAVACILTGIALARLFGGTRKERGFALGAGALLLGGNLSGIAVENKQIMFGEHVLASLAAQHPEVVLHTDPMTRYRADLLLQWNGARGRVVAAPPGPGSVYVYNPAHADAANARMGAESVAAYRPRPAWAASATYEAPPGLVARLLEASGLHAAVPPAIWRKLRNAHPPVTLYRVPALEPGGSWQGLER